MKRLILNVNRLFPAASRRCYILRDLRLNWATIVGAALVRHSYPYSLGVREISVCVDDQQAANMISKMKGNIIRALNSRYSYETDEGFKLIVRRNFSNEHRKLKPERTQAPVEIDVDEEKVRQYMQDAPTTLPDDINYAVSHLRVFLERRFNDAAKQHS